MQRIFDLCTIVSLPKLRLCLLLEQSRCSLPEATHSAPCPVAAILFDGDCAFCRRSIALLKRLDWFQRLTYVNFRDTGNPLLENPVLAQAPLVDEMHSDRLTERSLPWLRGFSLAGLAFAGALAHRAASSMFRAFRAGTEGCICGLPAIAFGIVPCHGGVCTIQRKEKSKYVRRPVSVFRRLGSRSFATGHGQPTTDEIAMSRRFVQQLADGDTIDEVFLVTDKQLRANRNGNLYLQLELRDRTGAISARLWNAGEHLFRSFEAGDFLRVKGKVQLFQGALADDPHPPRARRRRARSTWPTSCRTPSRTSASCSSGCAASCCKLSNPHLRALAECFLMDDEFVRGFCQVPGRRPQPPRLPRRPARARRHPARRRRPPAAALSRLDRDLLLMGIFLHDIGKVRELSYDRVFGYTDEGQLVGHLVIGVEMLNEKVAKVPDLTGEPFPPNCCCGSST